MTATLRVSFSRASRQWTVCAFPGYEFVPARLTLQLTAIVHSVRDYYDKIAPFLALMRCFGGFSPRVESKHLLKQTRQIYGIPHTIESITRGLHSSALYQYSTACNIPLNQYSLFIMKAFNAKPQPNVVILTDEPIAQAE